MSCYKTKHIPICNQPLLKSGATFIMIKSCLGLIQTSSGKNTHISDKFMSNVKSRINILPMNVHKHQLYLLEQHSQSFKFGQHFLGLTLRVNL